jgi:hypothetical protein
MGPLDPVSRRVSLLAAVVFAALGGTTFVEAQASTPSSGAEVEVRNVKFALVRPPSGGDAWLEATVELTVAANSAAGAYGRFADRVQVALSLSVRRRDDEFDFYRASAEAVSLEAGRAAFRFYLPPEILRREQMNTDPFAYAVDVSVRGRPTIVSVAALSSALRSAEVLRSFKDRVAQAAPGTDGVLVAQYLSPFMASYGSDTPAFVRRER